MLGKKHRIGGRSALSGFLVIAMVVSFATISVGSVRPSKTAPESSTKSLNYLLPAGIRKAGRILVASSIGLPPFEYYGKNGTTMYGIDIDVIKAVGKVLGVRMDVRDVRYPNILPSIVDGRFVLGISAIPVASAESTVNLVNYLVSGFGGYVVAKSNTTVQSNDPNSLCGGTIGVVTGETFQVPTFNAISANCVTAGLKPVTLSFYPSTTSILLAIESGHVTARSSTLAEGVYEDHEAPKQFKYVPNVVPTQNVPSIAGIAISKTQTRLLNAVDAAMKELFKNGTYHSIFKKWGITADQVPNIMVSGQ